MSKKTSACSIDIYQERYLAHQKRKKEALQLKITRKKVKHNDTEIMKLFKTRKSQRAFNSEQLTEKELDYILKAMDLSPSSCDRKGVYVKIVKNRPEKEILSGILVGGVGWINRADVILLLYADMDAYKNPAEQHNMPYLDAGVKIMSGYLASEALSIGCCYVNPNIRPENKEFFDTRFPGGLFCGALILGKY